MYDMAEYILGDPARVYTLSSAEIVQRQDDPADDRISYTVKNANWEQIAVTDSAILRGLDTSMSEERYYGLWNKAGQLGAVWCPRHWDGKPFLRFAEVRIFSKKDGRQLHQYTEESYLEILEHHPQVTFPSGVVVKDVLELVWYGKNASKNLATESYMYGKGFGLVGFKRGNGFATHITNTAYSTPPVRGKWPGTDQKPILPAPSPAPVPEPPPSPPVPAPGPVPPIPKDILEQYREALEKEADGWDLVAQGIQVIVTSKRAKAEMIAQALKP